MKVNKERKIKINYRLDSVQTDHKYLKKIRQSTNPNEFTLHMPLEITKTIIEIKANKTITTVQSQNLEKLIEPQKRGRQMQSQSANYFFEV